jgi:hypothetical protein
MGYGEDQITGNGHSTTHFHQLNGIEKCDSANGTMDDRAHLLTGNLKKILVSDVLFILIVHLLFIKARIL